MVLPEELQVTTFVSSNRVRSLQASLKYLLVAELTSLKGDLTSEVELPLYQPIHQSAPVTHVLENKVGGVFGVNRTTARTEFTISGSVFQPGESVEVAVNNDNSKCQSSVKNFKFKLWRKISYVLHDGQKVETGEYMTDVKIPGCKAKEAAQRE